MQALRSMLFTPGNRPDLIEKAIRSGTDAVIVDLEDAVPLDSKVAARDALAELPESDVPLYVRINGAETDRLRGDVVAAGRADIAGIVVPKAEDADLLRRISGALTALELTRPRARRRRDRAADREREGGTGRRRAARRRRTGHLGSLRVG